jgi:glycosyltransferase involved in cell wall biosynthesis
MAPLVSVIIPNYNYAQYLPQALDSVVAQTYPNVEIIVVDDGSTDESHAILRKYRDRIRLFQQHREGVSVARNRGAQESKGELIAFLDADDLWLPTKLERQVAKFIEDPDIGLVHCGWEAIDKSGVVSDPHLDGMDGWVAKELLLLRRPAVHVVGSGAVVTRDVFEKIGGFDTRLSTSADWDFSYRVAISRRVAFVPEVLVQYRQHGTNMHANIRLMEHDTLLAFSKAFTSGNREIQQLRRQSYGNLHMILAGSFFRAGQKADFARHALKSLWLTPGNIKRLLGYPLRRYLKTETRT